MALSECDPSQALFLKPAPAIKQNPARRKPHAAPDTPWGLACYLSDAIPRKWGVFMGLDDAERRHATKFMKALLEEHGIEPDRIRRMIDVFAEKVTGRKLDYPVGTFWAMRRELEGATAPAEERDYSDWEKASGGAQKDYSGWLR